jgi:hypothetical protein
MGKSTCKMSTHMKNKGGHIIMSASHLDWNYVIWLKNASWRAGPGKVLFHLELENKE